MSSIVTEPDHSLIHQSYNSRERVEPLNGDGFGVGWFILGDKEPAIFRSTTPAWNNANLTDLSRATKSHCIIAHVRAATYGAVNIDNCHPFRIENFIFCHNGGIDDFSLIKRKVVDELSDDIFNKINGNSDSAYFFALYMEYLHRTNDINNLENMGVALEKINYENSVSIS